MKYMIIVNEKEMIKEVIDYVDAFLFGIEDFSVNFPFYLTRKDMNEVITEIKASGKEVFISLNKNFHHDSLNILKSLLSELNELNLDGIFYYDVALVNLKKEDYFNIPLVWNQEHLTTNYDTCNFWQNQGVEMVSLSSEITLEEIKDIRANTTMKLIVSIFGYLPMFVSKRHLVNNYLEKFSLSGPEEQYFIKKEGNTYPIIDNKMGTEVYSAYILNGLEESIKLKEISIDYLLFNSFMIKKETMNNILNSYHEVTKENVYELEKKIEQELEQKTDKGFFYKETIFRVKKYEK